MRKTTYKTMLLLLLLLLVGLGAPKQSVAQTCNDYFILTENAEFEMLSFDRKDKQTGRATYKVTDVSSNSGRTEATIHSQVYDAKGKLTTEGDFKVTCESGTVWIDMRSLVNPDMLEAYKNMEVKMQGDLMNYPPTLTEGQKLEDGTFTIDVHDKESGQTLSTIVMSVAGRTVSAKENITVPAGTFEGYKISQDMEVKTRAMGMNMPGAKMQTVEWFVPGTGAVRSESYRKGKLLSYSVLSKVKQ